ncbi:MAG TPA: M14 metallopeptidase family protein [Thermoanaerobaculia bacterium]|nr:M14 metallopeptidase family protein [Thermoanaerobaculia bacterium]
MRRAVSLLLILLATSAFAQIPSPSAFLGFEVGADRKLADYRQIVSYFRALDAASPRLEVRSLGRTTLGEEMIMAVISSEENMGNLPRLREIARQLADPRGLTDAQIDALVREGKAIVLVTCNIHSNEIASSQMAMEWAHALVTATDPATKERLDNVVLLLVPSLNPDGQIMIADYYRKYAGTRWEGGPLPWLYHHYTGHDNNRDWFMLTQVETKNMSRAIYHEWFPQVFVDEHQMGSNGPRMFIPPFADPLDPDVHPLIWREVNVIGSNMAFRLEQQKKQGLIYGYSFDAYWLGGTRNTGWWKNITGLLLEVASARIASPVYIEPNELQGGRKGLVEYKATINHPNPWPGGWWRMRDIMDYERIASDALLETASERREDLLRNMVTRAREAIAAAAPMEAYRIPRRQHDWPTAQHLAAILDEHNVEVRQSPDGDYWIPMAQPYSKFIREMLEPQRYPEVRLQAGREILRPYDIATWTLPLQMGVTVEKTTMPANLQTTRVRNIKPETKEVIRRGEKLARKPRIATYKPWGGSIDEGWTRWLLDTWGFAPKALTPQELKAPGALAAFDAVILPDIHKEILATGRRKPEEGAMRYREEFPPEYRGSLEKGGADALRAFVEKGGTLIAFNEATEYVIDEFNIPVRNALARVRSDDFSVPGSLVRIHVRGDHPVTAGMPAETAAFIDSPIAFETTAPAGDVQRWVLAWYPEDARDILLSGWIHGAERLTRKAAAVAVTYGSGKIVLFGFRPQHRGQTHATFPLVFNALYWSVQQ